MDMETAMHLLDEDMRSGMHLLELKLDEEMRSWSVIEKERKDTEYMLLLNQSTTRASAKRRRKRSG